MQASNSSSSLILDHQPIQKDNKQAQGLLWSLTENEIKCGDCCDGWANGLVEALGDSGCVIEENDNSLSGELLFGGVNWSFLFCLGVLLLGPSMTRFPAGVVSSLPIVIREDDWCWPPAPLARLWPSKEYGPSWKWSSLTSWSMSSSSSNCSCII